MRTLFCSVCCLAVIAGGSSAIGRTIVGGGYQATDEVDFEFEHIAHTGTRALAGSDDGTVTVPIGFDFNLFGQTYNSVSLSPNGLMTFGGASSDWTNEDFTSDDGPSNYAAIAPLWDDWQFFQTGADALYHTLAGDPDARRFVVQWNAAYEYFDSPSSVTFQAVLYEEESAIRFNYLDVESAESRAFGAEATVGLRDVDGHFTGAHLQWSHNDAVIRDNTSIVITAIPEPAAIALAAVAALFSWRRR